MRARRAAGEGQQGDVAGAFDGHAEPALVTRADSGHAAGQNLAALLHELRKNVGALVVDEIHLLDAELADFLFAEILALAAPRTAGSATWAARATFTATTAWTAFAARADRMPALTARGSATFAAVSAEPLAQLVLGLRPPSAAAGTGVGAACTGFCSSDITSYLSKMSNPNSVQNACRPPRRTTTTQTRTAA